MRVACVGLGRMGHALASRLQDEGYELTIWNRTRGRGDDLLRAGATESATPGEAAAAADVVLSSLANDEAVRSAVIGADGVLAQIGDRPYVDTSTVSPELCLELASAFPRYVAMPVLGAPQAVRNGEATYVVGGEEEVVEDLKAILASLGGRVIRYDRPEKAASAKLAVNLMLLSGIATIAEALVVGRSGGLTDEQLTELVGNSPMMAPGLKNRLDGLVSGSGQAWWTTVLAAKDAGLAADAAHSTGKPLHIAPLVSSLYQAAADRGFPDADIVSVAELYR